MHYGIEIHQYQPIEPTSPVTFSDTRPLQNRVSFSSTRHGWDPRLEISVAYMRADCEAHEYGDTGKEARLRIELSRAIR